MRTELEELFAVDCDHVDGWHGLLVRVGETKMSGGLWRMRCG